MSMTKQEVQATNSYHADGCYIEVGPRGGLTYHIERWRASGQFQPRPRSGDWFQPVKFGMYESSRITEYSAQYYHDAATCALDHGWNDGAWLVFVLAADTISPHSWLPTTSKVYQVGYFRHGALVTPQSPQRQYQPHPSGGVAMVPVGLIWQEAHAKACEMNRLGMVPDHEPEPEQHTLTFPMGKGRTITIKGTGPIITEQRA